MGGKPLQGLSKFLMNTVSTNHTPAMMRAALKADLLGSIGALDAYKRIWSRQFPNEGPPVTWDQQSYDDLQDIEHRDIHEGLGDTTSGIPSHITIGPAQ